MKAAIQVSSRQEADSIRVGLDDPAVRAFVQIIGALKGLPTDRARKRVLEFVVDRLEEEQQKGKSDQMISKSPGPING